MWGDVSHLPCELVSQCGPTGVSLPLLLKSHICTLAHFLLNVTTALGTTSKSRECAQQSARTWKRKERERIEKKGVQAKTVRTLHDRRRHTTEIGSVHAETDAHTHREKKQTA